jgi:uncharacterized repeat protein (TIGR01451 family)
MGWVVNNDDPMPTSGIAGGKFGVLFGESSGLTGPFILQSPVQVHIEGGFEVLEGHLSMIGAVIQDLPPSHYEPILDYICGEAYPGVQGCDLLGLLEWLRLQGVNKDAMVYIGTLTLPDMDSMCFSVAGGLFTIINGHIAGAELTLINPHGPETVIILPDGEYCSTMAKTALRPIDPLFIEPASATTAQIPVVPPPPEPTDADLGLAKEVDVSEPVTLGTEVTFTITVTNNGPVDATGVRVHDMLPAGLEYVSSSGPGWYDPTSGIWHVGDLSDGHDAELDITAIVTSVGTLYNTATIAYADQPDPTSSNDTAAATVTGTEPPAVTSVNLAVGWNLVSLPLIPDPSDIDTVLADIQGSVNDGFGIWMWDASIPDWASSIPWDSSWAGDIDNVVDGPGYWINMDSAGSFDVVGYEIPTPDKGAPPSYDVYPGWNLIGFKSVTPRMASDYLAAISGKYTIIYRYTGGVYSIVHPADSLIPGQGYWIAVTDAGKIFP